MRKALLFSLFSIFAVWQLSAAESWTWRTNPDTGKRDFTLKQPEVCVDIKDGAVGDIGPRGAAGEITGVTATTLPEGSPATVTNSGSSSQAVLDFGIPVGATGAQGIQGIQGPSGVGTPPGGALNSIQYKYSSASTKKIFRGFGRYSVHATGGVLIL